MRYAGIKNKKISIVSDTLFSNDNYQIIPLPEKLELIDSKKIILNYIYKNGEFFDKTSSIPNEKLKLAIITNWKMQCGISTYAEKLLPHIANRIGDFKLFIEENSTPTSDIHLVGNQEISQDKVVECWKRGNKLNKLAEEIIQYDPDIILINHEWGLFPNARYWLSLMTQLSDYRIITILHSVFHHKDKTIVEASIPEIVVHLEGAKKVLKEEKGISGNVYVISHGSDLLDDSRLWNFYKSDHTLVQFGFGYAYKGYSNSIKAVSILKEKYPNIFFTAILSESPHSRNEHQLYYNELFELITTLNLQENVALIRGFQSDETISSYLKTNKIALFPYISNQEHAVFGASGACRVAMTKGIPIITSSVNHFADIPSIKADSPEEMATKIDELFQNSNLIKRQLDIQKTYLEETSWEKSSEKYLKLFSNR